MCYGYFHEIPNQNTSELLATTLLPKEIGLNWIDRSHNPHGFSNHNKLIIGSLQLSLHLEFQNKHKSFG